MKIEIFKMPKDVIKINNWNGAKPSGEIFVIYFSSLSNNTHRFVEKLNVPSQRIDVNLEKKLLVNQDFVLITPTYGGGGDDDEGSVPIQVKKFLNEKNNRDHCKGVIASGNTNFGNGFALAGPIISKKLNVPLLYQFELLGTSEDVNRIKEILKNFWGKK